MPKYIESFKSEQLRNFAYSLNDIWLDLHKKCDHSILVDGAVSSHLPMKHPFLVPGGRFIETYYWDNFWILEGILVSGMITTAQHILENHMHLIDEYGFVPNGSRVYYLNRSQPPYFANMVMAFYDHTQKSTELTSEEKYVYKRFVLDEALKCMIKEHKYWMRERSIKITHKGTEFKLNLFSPQNDQPRPESYSEDIHTASHCQTDAERAKCYKDLSAGAESGIDFSSRWFKDPMNIQTIHTTDIIPVCLNALLYKTETSLAMLCNEKADMIGFKRYRNLGLKRKTVINSLLWSKKLNCWTDYNHRTKKLYEKDFYITNLSPLFNDIKPPKHRVKELMEKHVCSLNLINSNGIPFSFTNSMEQWDFSNIWAPNQYQVIMLLTKVNRDLALKFAKKFFTTVYTGWLNTGMIFEKYSTLELGNRGSGGEYLVQSGFGWTNGTILSLMKEFGDELFS
jgi:alpha,alpha-trehalase